MTKQTKQVAKQSMEALVKDTRQQNPGLHALYVKNACTHILAINKAIADLGRFSNLNLLDAQQALVLERDKLITTDPAFYVADELLDSLMPYIKKNLRYATQFSTRLTKCKSSTASHTSLPDGVD